MILLHNVFSSLGNWLIELTQFPQIWHIWLCSSEQKQKKKKVSITNLIRKIFTVVKLSSSEYQIQVFHDSTF